MAETVRVIIENPVSLTFAIITIFTVLGLLAVVVIKQGKGIEISKNRLKIGESKAIVTSSKNDAKSDEAEERYKIEGIWGDWSGKLKDPRCSFVQISRDDHGFVINGEEYDENYRKIAEWTSDVSKFRKTMKLEYLLTGSGYFKAKKVIKASGYTTINFRGDIDKPPNRYSGSYIDVLDFETGENRPGSFDGRRLTDEEKDLYLGGSKAQRLVIDKLIEKARIRAKEKEKLKSDHKNC